MNQFRRTFLKGASASGAIAAAIAAGLLKPGQVLAAEWNKAAFTATKLEDALKAVNGTNAAESKQIIVKAPDIAENGAVVPVEVISNIPNTEAIDIVIETNVNPLTASYQLENGAVGYISTRVKMAKSSKVRAIVKAGGKTYTAAKEVKVTIGGCGG
ncbi:MAG: thiosulfate oxidation carrier protein SoxY [Sulfuricellaceae bacterium]|nr:thiosulfate oxidation carrier protein SoxY [Sulfuricellaceae bacterium]